VLAVPAWQQVGDAIEASILAYKTKPEETLIWMLLPEFRERWWWKHISPPSGKAFFKIVRSWDEGATKVIWQKGKEVATLTKMVLVKSPGSGHPK
jgi:hypothetical protein